MIYILDFGYLSFYRYHACKRYFGFKDEPYDLENPWQNEGDFRECVLKQIEKMIKSFSKRGKNKIYFACEALNGTKNWRKVIFPDYKGNREKNEDIYTYMTYIYDEFLPNLCDDNNKILRGNYEADDAIAFKIREIDDREEVIIISSDHDFLQLVEDDNNISLLDAKGNNVAQKKKIYGKKYLKTKILDGDKSDNISPIFSGKNKTKRRDALLEKIEKFNNLDDVSIDVFDGDVQLFEKFKMNRLLIDFDKIIQK